MYLTEFLRRFIILVMCFSLFPYALHAQNMHEDIVLYMDFDDPIDSGVVRDLSGAGNDGEIIGNLKHVDGKFGKAIQNDGGVNYVKVSHNDGLNPTDGKFTLMSWVFMPNAPFGWDQIIMKWNDDPNEYCYHFALRDGGLFHCAILQTNGLWLQPVDTQPLSAETWYHLAAIADGEKVKVYKNGKQVGFVNYDGTINLVSADIGIGNKPRGVQLGFHGIIDEVAIWNRALSEQELLRTIEGLKNALSPVNSSGKLASTWGNIKTAVN